MFKAKRIELSYNQTINAAAETVFPLLCPVRESEWLDGWNYEMIYSESGMTEAGAVFSTTHIGEEDTIWVITLYDIFNHRIHFTRFTPGIKVCVIEIEVKNNQDSSSRIHIVYTYTAISRAGNQFIDNFDKNSFIESVRFWEASMNYFLETGQQLARKED